MLERVFVLTHSHELPSGEEDIKLIGVYSSRTRADAALATAAHRPGFREFPDGFHVDPYVLDEDHWIEGFSTWVPDSA